ncbi:NAD(P)-dependent oxidoreductase, partial [Corynebacterium diphtheriae]|uniref:NAD(P)-dependent oxidoreductase n=1 Tax=Corynebacterium diphtheriae TaxID=1717 RepID=UPI0023EF2F40
HLAVLDPLRTAAGEDQRTLKTEEPVIAGAGLEVVDPEPLPDSHALHSMPNCTITPHMAASDHVAELHVARIFDANAQAFTRGETMPTEVNPHLGY